jgi:hypothetical protein
MGIDMEDKLSKLSIILILFSIGSLVIGSLTIPRIGTAPPDPWWPLKIIPVQYWAGLSTTTASYIVAVAYTKKSRMLILFPLLLMAFILIPRLMFSNPIWTDNYGFVSEVLYILRCGNVGPICHAEETPGLSLLASQLSLITGMEHLMLAEIIPFILSFFLIIAVYLFARVFFEEKPSSMVAFVFLSLFWFGLHFNRESFALPSYCIILYLLARRLIGIGDTITNDLLLFTLYIANVISHPGTSITLIMIVVTYFLIKVKYGSEGSKLKHLIAEYASPLVLTLMVLWLSWYIHHYGTLDRAIGETLKSISEALNSISPSQVMSRTFYRYTSEYLPIVILRAYEAIFATLVGLSLSIMICITSKFKHEYFMLSSSFLGILPLMFYCYVVSTWRATFYRAFLYSLPAVSTLISWFIFKFKPKAGIMRFFTLLFKATLLTTITLYMMILPLLTYSHAAFAYPPSSEVAMDEFIANHAEERDDFIWGIEPESPGIYVIMAHQVKIRIVGYHYVPNLTPDSWLIYENNKFNIMATTFRTYVKDAFEEHTPTLLESLTVLESKLSNEAQYRCIYNAGHMNKIYVMGRE